MGVYIVGVYAWVYVCISKLSGPIWATNGAPWSTKVTFDFEPIQGQLWQFSLQRRQITAKQIRSRLILK